MSSRYVSAASVVAAVVLAGFQILLEPWSGPQLVVTLFCIVAALLVVVRHVANLRRLWYGTENQLKESSAMFVTSKVIYVMAVGLWFGMVVFFTLAGGLMIQAFEKVADKEERPLWFPLPDQMKKERPSDKFPDPLRREQASRAFGVAVTPLFPWYYGIQAGCALLGTLTAVGWCLSGAKGGVHFLRTVLLILALGTVVVGWWLEGVVNDKRGPRDQLSEEVIKNPASPAEVEAAGQARADFVRWHLYSLAQNGVTLLLVTGAMALAALLPVAAPLHTDTENAVKNGELVAG
jgi:hypothetical protein